ncbi:MAG: prolyl oligopeptidase family serine peptidase [Planctomycetota bacterium]|nr:prolyl oligopeptidase family serine peptidase [Planctomycetota bacterium]
MQRLTLAALLGLPLVLAASPALAQVLPTHNDLVYGVLGSPQQPRPITLDLYLPSTGQGPFPVIIRIHGGGWQGGTNQPIPALYQTLLQRGFAIASVRYRLTSQSATWAPSPVVFPAQINDVKGAVRWLRAHAATYSLDPTRFGSCGESAGGHLSALLGTSGDVGLFTRGSGAVDLEGAVGGNLQWSSAVQASADYFGPTDLLNMTPDITTPPGGMNHDVPTSAESRLLGWDQPGQGVGDIRANLDNPADPYPQLAALAIGAGPVTHVDPADPPFFIAHGQQDTTVPYNQSVRLRDALQASGVPVTLLANPSGGHSTFPAGNDAIVAFFVDRLITNPPRVCAGDANSSQAVDFADVTAILGRFGAPGGVNAPGDANGDGTVNFNDITTALNHWGERCD